MKRKEGYQTRNESQRSNQLVDRRSETAYKENWINSITNDVVEEVNHLNLEYHQWHRVDLVILEQTSLFISDLLYRIGPSCFSFFFKLDQYWVLPGFSGNPTTLEPLPSFVSKLFSMLFTWEDLVTSFTEFYRVSRSIKGQFFVVTEFYRVSQGSDNARALT